MTRNPSFFDVVIIGAGAAGMMCAAEAGARGRRVLLLDHAAKLGERIRISGGGRCNFSNREVSAANYLSQNPHFCRSALARFTPADFIEKLQRHGIPWHERKHGQLFCERSAQDVIEMLLAECDRAGVQRLHPCAVGAVRAVADGEARFEVAADRGSWRCRSLVVASGGVAVPKLGASPFGYRLAERFGLPVVPPKAALVPLSLPPEVLVALKPLSGVSVAAETRFDGMRKTPSGRFREDVLVTHRGLSGPAILQISSYWQMQAYAPRANLRPVCVDLLPGMDAGEWLEAQRHSKGLLPNLLAGHLPRRFAHEWCELHGVARPLNELSKRDLAAVAQALNAWELMPSGTLGYAKAEVTLGGVDTRALSSKTMEATALPGLFFIGEVVDVTGWLGGYNFQWAWSSGWVAGQFA